jgi:hypothetical protein
MPPCRSGQEKSCRPGPSVKGSVPSVSEWTSYFPVRGRPGKYPDDRGRAARGPQVCESGGVTYVLLLLTKFLNSRWLRPLALTILSARSWSPVA